MISTVAELAESRADAQDRLIMSDAREYGDWDGDILVLEDTNLALTYFALARLQENSPTARVFVRTRSYALTQQLVAERHHLPPVLQSRLVVEADALDIKSLLTFHTFEGKLAIGRLPKSHGALADWAESFAGYALENDTGEVAMVLGGNTKHMSKAFNETLGHHFENVNGLRGKGKHRCLHASGPKLVEKNRTSSSRLVGIGGVFSGAKADLGGQFLAEKAEEFLTQQSEQLTVLDFGCGNGSVSFHLLAGPVSKRINRLTATDIDADAIRSASTNLRDFTNANFLWDDAASHVVSDSFNLVLLNPPFHEGTKVDLTMVQPMLESALRVLKPGGVLLLVHNSHARYRPEIEQRFSKVKQVDRNTTFTVVRAEKPAE